MTDSEYRDALLSPLRKCADYKPKFGGAARGGAEAEMSVGGFQALYGADPLYAWIGLDSPLMYAAHKAAGGMTSIYRQLGIGCERLVRAVLADRLGLQPHQMAWTYGAVDERGKAKTLTLDARIDTADIGERAPRERFQAWLLRAGAFVGHPEPGSLRGVVFEVRQGYKSADSKRQNADLAFGNRAGLTHYLPAIMIMSTQISVPVIKRYRAASMLVLTGSRSADDRQSTLAFFDNAVGFSLADFFERNSAAIKIEVATVLEGLLTA